MVDDKISMPIRTQQRTGKNNILLVAPHGHKMDDTHTDVLTAACAEYLDASMVVNVGWKRDPQVNPDLGIANCNDIRHCLEAAVSETFLKPIHEAMQKIIARDQSVLLILLHGMADEDLDIVVGCGNTQKPKLTCDIITKERFQSCLRRVGFKVAESHGGKFSARNKHNLAQALKTPQAKIIQAEISWKRRNTEDIAKETGVLIGRALGHV